VARVKAIVICTPSLGVVSFWWARQMMSLVHPLNIGKKFAFVQDDGDSGVADTRNQIVHDVLRMDNDTLEVDSLFWVDDDVLVMPGALLALYNHHVPIASGVYFTKCELPEALIFPGRLHGTAKFYPNEIIRDGWGHGMGLCLIKADVYRKMAAAGLGVDRHGKPEWYKTSSDFKLEGSMIDCGGTEDLFFLNRAGELGYKTVIDCTKHAFGWHYDLKTGLGYPQKQFNQWAHCQPIAWETNDGPVTWE
jgi:hypothetical protein